MQLLQKKLSNFSILDNAILQDGGLSLEARGLYAYMVSLPNDWQFSYDRLAKANNVGLRVIRRVIAELENAKLLKRDFTTTNKGSVVKYILFDSKTREQNATLQIATLQNATSQNATPYKELIDTKKESNKEINSFSDFKKSPKKSSKEVLLDYANEIYENELKNNNLAFSKEQWLEWVDYKLKRQYRLTKRTLELNLKQLCDFGADAYNAIQNSIACGYQGLFLNKIFKNQSKKVEYNPRTGNTGESLFSDNPNDYINEDMNGVTKIADGIFEADLFKLTGRKA